MLFLFVYTKMHNYYGERMIFFPRSLFSIHEICILWPFSSDMMDYARHLKGSGFGSLADYSRPNPLVILGLLNSLNQRATTGLDLQDLLALTAV